MNRGSGIRSRGAAVLLEQIARAVYIGREGGDMFPAQWAALRFFDRAGVQACTVGGLARYLGVTRGPASRTASSLVGRGLVETRANPDDGRTQLFSLTEAGAETLARDPLADLAVAIDELDHEITEHLFAALDDIYTVLMSKRPVK